MKAVGKAPHVGAKQHPLVKKAALRVVQRSARMIGLADRIAMMVVLSKAVRAVPATGAAASAPTVVAAAAVAVAVLGAAAEGPRVEVAVKVAAAAVVVAVAINTASFNLVSHAHHVFESVIPVPRHI